MFLEFYYLPVYLCDFLIIIIIFNYFNPVWRINLLFKYLNRL